MLKTLNVLLLLTEEEQMLVFEILDSLLSCCELPGLILVVLEMLSCSLFCRNHLSTSLMQSVSVLIT